MKLVKYSATWCQPCKQLTAAINQIDLQAIELVEHDVDLVDKSKLQEHGVRAVPTLVLLDDVGVVLKKTSGAMTTKQLQEWLGIS